MCRAAHLLAAAVHTRDCCYSGTDNDQLHQAVRGCPGGHSINSRCPVGSSSYCSSSSRSTAIRTACLHELELQQQQQRTEPAVQLRLSNRWTDCHSLTVLSSYTGNSEIQAGGGSNSSLRRTAAGLAYYCDSVMTTLCLPGLLLNLCSCCCCCCCRDDLQDYDPFDDGGFCRCEHRQTAAAIATAAAAAAATAWELSCISSVVALQACDSCSTGPCYQ
jgi:hypothetical protein